MVVAGKVFLVAATLLFLSSIGGAMAVAMPLLVPLHWAAARTSVKFEYGLWVLLALLSVWEATYIYALLVDADGIAVVGLVVAASALSVLFIATTSSATPAGQA